MDNKKIVADLVHEIYSVSNNLMTELLKIVHFESIPKNQIFINENKRNESEYFILSGICRSYLINLDGEDITLSFFQDKSILTPNVARTLKGFSILNHQALTSLEVGIFNADKFVDLTRKYPEFRNFANIVLQNELILKVNKEISNASLPAKERLLEFRKQYKHLENIIPHPYIASYLGITNISLSRIRGDLANS